MDDLASKLTELLRSPEGMQKLQTAASALASSGILDQNAGQQSNGQAAAAPDLSALLSAFTGGANTQQPGQNSAGPDLSGLAQMLSSAMSGQTQQQPAASSNAPDLSALLPMLSAFSGQDSSPQNGQNSSGGMDLSSLAPMLSSLMSQGNSGQGGENPLSGLNLSALAPMLSSLLGGQGSSAGDSGGSSAPLITPALISSLQKAFSSFRSDDKNTQLLRSLQPLLSEKRAKRVDDAVRIMQLIKVMPIIQESGLFGSLGGAP